MTVVGMIGLGTMGIPMARNLLKAGVEVRGYDLSALAVARFAEVGGIAVDSIAELVHSVDVVISMLPAAQHVRSLYEDAEGVFDCAQPAQILIDASTIGINAARHLHRIASEKGLRFLDAPVSGAVPAAQAATLVFMVGGDCSTATAVEPLLLTMGSKVVHAGTGGNGQAVKVCNNMAAGIIKAAISEAFVLADALGIDPKVFFDAASNGSAQSFALNVLCPVPDILANAPSSRNYSNGFATKLMHKDLLLAREAALEAGVNLRIANATTDLFGECTNAGFGEFDNSILYQYLKGNNTEKYI